MPAKAGIQYSLIIRFCHAARHTTPGDYWITRFRG